MLKPDRSMFSLHNIRFFRPFMHFYAAKWLVNCTFFSEFISIRDNNMDRGLPFVEQFSFF